MGSIYDRNGLPLATSDWSELEKHRAEYQQLGIDIDRACPRNESRHYPFGGLLFDFLGDLRTRTRWAASNTSFVERDSARRLRGYDDRPTLVEIKNPKTHATERVLRYDYRELVPLLRHRYDPQNPAVRRILDRPRNVKMSLDARLEVRIAEILRKQLQQSNRDKGAAVVMDPATGDLLAAVSFPLPADRSDARIRIRTPTSTARAMDSIRRDPPSKWSPPWPPCAKIRASRTRPTNASACPMAAPATTSKAGTGPSATTWRTRARTEP